MFSSLYIAGTTRDINGNPLDGGGKTPASTGGVGAGSTKFCAWLTISRCRRCGMAHHSEL
jgi:hypothetical protein